jgi:hypothetical protein
MLSRIRDAARRYMCTSCKPTRREMTVVACLVIGLVVMTVVLISGQTAVAGPISDQQPPQKSSNRAEEEQMLKDARECMVKADPCYARACYAGYMQKYGKGGTLYAIIQTDLARSRQACPLYADGLYNAKSVEGCGGRSQFGIHIAIKDGTISWDHDFRGASYKWVGVIEPDGTIRASVGESKERVATGQYNEENREIQMHYPECGNAVPLSIIGRIN